MGGDWMAIAERDDGRPMGSISAAFDDEAAVLTPDRVTGFLLSNLMDVEAYEEAVAGVRRMGFDPDATPHFRPTHRERS